MLNVLMAAVTAMLALADAGRAWRGASEAPPEELLTVAEKSGYKATAKYDDVEALADRLVAWKAAEGEAGKGGLVRKLELGKTTEGRSIPLLIVADPPVGTPEEAARSGKMVVLLFGNIHAGEVEGKEALMMLARDIITSAERPLLKDMVLAIVPIYNADGNERFGPTAEHRPGQVGPEEGVGIRENATGLDLNRDYVKLEAPETRAIVHFMGEWDPAMVIDTHTTNGSHHRYTLTYMGPTNPAGSQEIIKFVRDTMLPAVGKALLEKTGVHTFFYGNLEPPGADHTQWTTYPDLPRYGAPYVGLRNRLAILSEAYAYAPFKERVEATRDFCRGCLEYAAEKKDEIRGMIRKADEATVTAGREPKDGDEVPIRSEVKSFAEKVTALGFVEEERDGKRVATQTPKDYTVELVNDFVPTVTVKRPFAYLFPASLTNVVENLRRHGAQVEELREDIEVDVEAYRIEAVAKAMRPFQGHDLLDVNATATAKTERMPAGTIVVRTAQPLGTLAAYLLEPRSADGLCAWNFFDQSLSLGSDFPVVRVAAATPMLTTRVRPLAEYRTMNKPITYDALFGLGGGGGPGGGGINFNGSPAGGMRWLEDGEHYLQARDGALRKVDAATGRSERFFDPAPMSAALAKLPTIGDRAAKQMAENPGLNMNRARTAALFEHENDLYYAALDGSVAARLTSTPAPEEDASFSPDGKFVAFVRSNDLWVVDVATGGGGTERALTQGGTDLVRNGKNDWVYYEELYNRSWRAYWWSPDSSRIAFLQVDSTPVPRWTLPADHTGAGSDPQNIETAPYPKPGQPNPLVKLGIVTAAGGPVRWADLSDYDEGHFLITDVGWLAPPPLPPPPGTDLKEQVSATSPAWCYVQDRTQTWMDLLSIPAGGGKPTRLMREKTEAWVEPVGQPRVLKDGSFLLPSERTGYKHIYHFAKDGKLIKQVTDGEWEARSIELVDEKTDPPSSAWVYFSGTADSPIASNLYRVRLDGTGMERLTVGGGGGSHGVTLAPTGKSFIDSWSDHAMPARVALYGTEMSASGPSLLRTLDTNPVYAVEEYKRGEFELVHIPMPDGFVLEASVLKPPDFDDSKKYPVWLMTYAGPHAPTVSDTWGGGRTYDEMLAQMGIVVFRVDPRSASGKGAKSAWAAYHQLGVPELKDLEEAVKWLTNHPWIDASRVGIAGGSYGGFMTAFALTHSKLFAAGVATSSPTDWHDYDSIYTERYMGLPQDNPEGYDATSVVKAAKNLHGRLLLLHGTMDDNVHMQNSIKLARALEDANKQFEFMVYPGSRHGIGSRHYRQLVVEFIARTFRLEAGGEVGAGQPTDEGRGDRPRRDRPGEGGSGRRRPSR